MIILKYLESTVLKKDQFRINSQYFQFTFVYSILCVKSLFNYNIINNN